MPCKKGERVEAGICRCVGKKGYLVDVSIRDVETEQRIRRRRTFPRLDLAREWRDRTRVDGLKGEIRREKQKRITFADFAEEYLRWWGPKRRPSFVAAETTKIKKGFNPVFGCRYLHTLTLHDLESYLVRRQAGLVGPWQGRRLTKASVNREICRIKHMLGKAVEWGYLEVSPAAGIKQEREVVREADYLEVEEVRRLLAACDERLYPAVLMAVNTGLRWGEQMKLQWKDVDFRLRQITLRNTKNHETRHVPMNERLAEALAEHRKTQVRMGGRIIAHVFVNPASGQPYTDLRKRFGTALRRAGIQRHFTWHGLRHTAASQLVMAGVNLRTVGKILGHKSYAMTLRYAHVAPGFLQDATEKLSSWLAGADGHSMDTGGQNTSQNTESRPEDGSVRKVVTES